MTDIHQFDLDTPAENEWRATAKYEITEFMAELGCRKIVCARTFQDLELLCMAERVKSQTARASEQLAVQQALADR